MKIQIPIWNIADDYLPMVYRDVLKKDVRGIIKECFAFQYSNGDYAWCEDDKTIPIEPTDQWIYKKDADNLKKKIYDTL